ERTWALVNTYHAVTAASTTGTPTRAAQPAGPGPPGRRSRSTSVRDGASSVRSGGSTVVAIRLASPSRLLAEQPRRPHHEHADQHDQHEGGRRSGQLVARDVELRHVLHDAEQQPAGEGTRHRCHAPEHGGGEGG